MNIQSGCRWLLLSFLALCLRPLSMSPSPWQSPDAGNSQETIRVHVNLVTMGVRVTDRRGREIEDLIPVDFQVLEDGRRQPIAFFARETQPLSLGILLDTSGSMSAYKMESAKSAALYILQSQVEAGEYLFRTFDDELSGSRSFDSDRKRIADSISASISRGGGTILYDAVSMTLENFLEAKHGRRALVVITDGVDQHSRRTLQDVVEVVQRSQVQVYIVGYFDHSEDVLFRESGETISLVTGRVVSNPRHAFRKLAEESGALAYFPTSGKDLEIVAQEIARDLKHQYTLAYYSPNPHSADYRIIEVRVRRSGSQVRHRRGYRIHSP